MFTGIIEELGEVLAWERSGDSGRLTIKAPLAVSDAKHGDSISVDGVCLTVVDQGPDWFTADVMAVSIATSTLGSVGVGQRVDIERAAALGDRLGGHLVQGHIDGTASVLASTDGDAWRVLRFTLDPEHAPLVVRKGSIAVNGVSLTVSDAGDDWFEVSLIPETLAATTLGALTPGDRVNIETDILARHVQRLIHFGGELTGLRGGAVGAFEVSTRDPAARYSTTDSTRDPADRYSTTDSTRDPADRYSTTDSTRDPAARYSTTERKKS
jgi:riboflavin synthase